MLARSLAIFLTALLSCATLQARTLYTNTFDNTSSLAGLTTGTGATGGSVAITDGQLHLHGAPFNYRGAYVAIPAPTILGQNKTMRLADIGYKVVWAFNLSNFDYSGGGRNNGFEITLVGNRAIPYEGDQFSYTFQGGIYVGNIMRLSRSGSANSIKGPQNVTIIDVPSDAGLAPLPQKGSFRIEYYPSSQTWRLFAEYGDTYVDPMRVTKLLGSGRDSAYASDGFSHFVISSENDGGLYLDNLTIATYDGPLEDSTPPGQIVDFRQPADRVFTPVPFSLQAAASSGLPVTLFVAGGPATIVDGLVQLTGIGYITIGAMQAGSPPYDPAVTQYRTFLVTARPIDFGLESLTLPYSGTPRTLSAVSNPPGVPLRITYAGEENGPVEVGSYPVVIESASENYTGRRNVTFTITRAPLRVSPAPATRLIGQANPLAYALDYEGFVGDDTPADLDQLPLGSTKAKVSSPVGDYPVTLAGGADDNYAYVFVPGTLHVVSYGGSYEALLTSHTADDAAQAPPLGKLEITVSTTKPTFTGRLTLLGETSSLPVSGALGGLDTDGAVSGFWTYQRAAKGVATARHHALEIKFDAHHLTARLTRGTTVDDATPFAVSDEGASLYRARPRITSPWSGAHTLLLQRTDPLDAEGRRTPSHGTGYASASIKAADGTLTLRGYLGDGTSLTSSTKPDTAGRHRLLARPYGKRLDSALAGRLDLVAHPTLSGRHHLPGLTDRLHWSKTALPTDTKTPDATVRGGFAPLAVSATLEPWLPPVAAKRATKTQPAIPAITLVDRLGMTESANGPGGFDIAHAPFIENALLPPSGTLASNGRVTVASEYLPWTAKISTSDGTFTGSFRVSHPSPTSNKIVHQTIKFRGIMRQRPSPDDAEDTLVGAGVFILPPPPGVRGVEGTAGEIRFDHSLPPTP